MVCNVTQAHTLEPVARSLRSRAAPEPFELPEIRQQVADLGSPIDASLLGQLRRSVQRGMTWGGPEERNLAFVSAKNVETDSNQRGLPGAVRTEQAKDLPRQDLERDVRERSVPTEALGNASILENSHERSVSG